MFGQRKNFRRAAAIAAVGAAVFGCKERHGQNAEPKTDTLPALSYSAEKPPEKTLKIPPRKKDAISGSEFMKLVRKTHGAIYEEMIFQEILSEGNVPDFMRPENFRELMVKGKADGLEVEMRLRICADYVAIGSNEDYVRVPLSAVGFRTLASLLGMSLPTRKLVDDIYRAAEAENGLIGLIDGDVVSRASTREVIHPETNRSVRLSEVWRDPAYEGNRSRFLLTPEFALLQSRLADEIKEERGLGRFALVCGNKKDIVVDAISLRKEHRNNLVQYRPDHPQGFDYGAHLKDHSDYSLGARLIGRMVEVTIRDEEGKSRIPMPYEDVVRHPLLYKLLSDVRFDMSRIYR